MKSQIYIGEVIHQRFSDKAHFFKYGLYLLYLDLDELPFLFEKMKFFSYGKRNFSYFKRSDYHGNPSVSLKEAVYQTVKDKTGKILNGPIRMLTQMRVLGVCFNPVTFYYCFDSSGEKVECILAEIENTPWKERYSYVVEKVESSFKKEFHISPFFDMEINYSWKFSNPGNFLDIDMFSYKNEKKLFHAGLAVKSLDLNEKNLNKMLYKFPWMSAKIVLGIYYQAFRIWLRGTTFYSHPNTENQRSLLFLKGRKK